MRARIIDIITLDDPLPVLAYEGPQVRNTADGQQHVPEQVLDVLSEFVRILDPKDALSTESLGQLQGPVHFDLVIGDLGYKVLLLEVGFLENLS